MRCPASADASATMVMRESPTRSPRPTVSEMMLMFRRRKSDATRVSTPGLSSTYATNVCSINASPEIREQRSEISFPSLSSDLALQRIQSFENHLANFMRKALSLINQLRIPHCKLARDL